MRKILLATIAVLAFTVSPVNASDIVTKYGVCKPYNGGKSVSLEMEWVRGTTNLVALNVDHIGMAYKDRVVKSNDGSASIKLFANRDEFIYRIRTKDDGVFQYVMQMRNGQMVLQQGTSNIFPNIRAKFECFPTRS